MFIPRALPIDQSQCSSGATFRSRGHRFHVVTRLSPQPRSLHSEPVLSAQAQALCTCHSRATGRSCRRVPNRGWRQSRLGSPVLGPDPALSPLPQARSRGGSETTLTGLPAPPQLRLLWHPVRPHTWRLSKRSCGQTGWAAGNSSSDGSSRGLWDRKWDRTGGWNPVPYLGRD